jgi:hypothetical protein
MIVAHFHATYSRHSPLRMPLNPVTTVTLVKVAHNHHSRPELYAVASYTLFAVYLAGLGVHCVFLLDRWYVSILPL